MSSGFCKLSHIIASLLLQSLGHAGDEGPHLSMTGESRGCSRAAAPVCGFSRGQHDQGLGGLSPWLTENHLLTDQIHFA